MDLYFNTASFAKPPVNVMNAFESACKQMFRFAPSTSEYREFINNGLIASSKCPSEPFQVCDSWHGIRNLRDDVANLFNYESKHVLLSSSATSMMHMVLPAFLSMEKGNVVTTDADHPVEIASLRAITEISKQLELRVVEIQEQILNSESHANPEDAILSAIDSNTRLILICDSLYITGDRLNIARIADELKRRNNSAILMVDGVQSAGSLDISDVTQNADFFFSSGHKWMEGIPTSAFGFAKSIMMEHLAAKKWSVYESFSIPESIRNDFETDVGSQPSISAFVGLKESIRKINEEGIGRRIYRISNLVERLREMLGSIPSVKIVGLNRDGLLGAIVTIAVQESKWSCLCRGITEAKVTCKIFEKKRLVRFSLSPTYATESMIDSLSSLVKSFVI